MSRMFSKRAAVEAVGFFLAGVLSVIVRHVYSDMPFGNVSVIALLACVGFSLFYYWLRLPGLSITRKRVVEDMLLAAGVSLGKHYRLNLMKPINHNDDSKRHFVFLCQFRMSNIHNYHDCIKLSTPGVGQAYNERKVFHLEGSSIDHSIDEYPKHIWSISVESHKGPRCVLNIDTCDASLPQERVEFVSSVIQDLSKVIAKYNPGKFSPE